MLCWVGLGWVGWGCVVLCCVVLCCVVLCCVVLCCVGLGWVGLGWVGLCCVVLCCVVLCCVVLCCVVLCCVVLCCVVLCCVVLGWVGCCVVLGWVGLGCVVLCCVGLGWVGLGWVVLCFVVRPVADPLAPHFRQIVRLLVADQELFDSAFTVDCGPPRNPPPNYDFTGCDYTSTGTCQRQCQEPWAGAPTAKCTVRGEWEYGGSCMGVATCFTMGLNSFGQLGTRTTDDSAVPRALHASNEQPIHAVVAAGWHTAFLTESAAYVMGSNQYGQLGLGLGVGIETSRSSPQILRAPNGHAVTAVALGNSHTVFLAGGRAYAMGENRVGQLGLPATVILADTPQPLAAPTGASVATVAAGPFQTAVVTAPGADSGAAPQLYGQWWCLFPRIAVRLDENGDAQCLSEDGASCYEPPGGCAATSNVTGNRSSLTCGAQHRQLFGVTGYEEVHPRHWCHETRLRLTGLAPSHRPITASPVRRDAGQRSAAVQPRGLRGRRYQTRLRDFSRVVGLRSLVHRSVMHVCLRHRVLPSASHGLRSACQWGCRPRWRMGEDGWCRDVRSSRQGPPGRLADVAVCCGPLGQGTCPTVESALDASVPPGVAPGTSSEAPAVVLFWGGGALLKEKKPPPVGGGGQRPPPPHVVGVLLRCICWGHPYPLAPSLSRFVLGPLSLEPFWKLGAQGLGLAQPLAPTKSMGIRTRAYRVQGPAHVLAPQRPRRTSWAGTPMGNWASATPTPATLRSCCSPPMRPRFRPLRWGDSTRRSLRVCAARDAACVCARAQGTRVSVARTARLGRW